MIRLDPQTVIAEAEVVYYLPAGTIKAWGRTNTQAQARAVAMHILHRHSIFSFEEISTIFNREVSGVKKNCKKIEKMLEKNGTWIKENYNQILTNLGVVYEAA